MNENLTKEQQDDIMAILHNFGSDRKNLIPILQDIQAKLLYLPVDAMREVARHLKISGSVVYGVATFYNQFRLTPPGKH
ncbi:MAG: NAD(P)H-dependent oxidoreductase subunit E, partial [Chloroflexi bacterium]|nr:NAD(P)H-dependent oxidoreductase subunit E [Chloroflexota bacterium]